MGRIEAGALSNPLRSPVPKLCQKSSALFRNPCWPPPAFPTCLQQGLEVLLLGRIGYRCRGCR